MNLARTHKLTTYDGAYLELAVRRGLPLASLDEDLKKAARQVGVTIDTPPTVTGLKPEQEGHLFVNRSGQPLSRSGIAEIIDRHLRQAGVSTPGLRGRKVTPHTIRHTKAMHLLQSGVEVNVIRSWLGHVSIPTTNRYIEIDLEMKRKALEACEIGRGDHPADGWQSSRDILTWLESL